MMGLLLSGRGRFGGLSRGWSNGGVEEEGV
jgi:hypothetical protein